MSKIFALSLLLLVNTIYSQSNFNTQYSDPKEVVITGTIKNFEKYPDIDAVNLIVNDIGLSEYQTYYGKIDKNGNFKIHFSLYFPQDVRIDYRSLITVIAHPGDSINVELDADWVNDTELFNSIKFSGDRANTNAQLFNYRKEMSKNELTDEQTFSANRKLEYEEYIEFCDSIKNLNEAAREKYINEVNPEEEVVRWTYWDVEMEYISALINHQSEYINLNYLKSSDWNFDNKYYRFLESLQQVDESSLINTSVSDFLPMQILHDYFGAKLRQKFNDEISYDLYDSLLLPHVLDFNTSDILKQLIFSQLINLSLSSNQTDFYEQNLALIEKQVSAPYLIEPIKARYKSIKEFWNEPLTKIGSIVNKLERNNSKESFESKFKGKVLFIDCWATWCGPCKEEMKYSKKMIDKFVGQDVEFIFFCFNSDYNQWLKLKDELQTGGTHYYLNKEESKNLGDLLSIGGYPSYFLLDKNGNIIKENVPEIRPSNPDAEEEIKKLLQ